MNARVLAPLRRAGAFFLLPFCIVAALAAEPPAREMAAAYIEGVEALEATDYKRAVELISRAIAADEENSDYFRARGVANTLAENFPAAIADLQRALRLHGDDREARLWLAAAYRMAGDPATGSQYFSVSGVPPTHDGFIWFWEWRGAAGGDGCRLHPSTHRRAGTI